MICPLFRVCSLKSVSLPLATAHKNVKKAPQRSIRHLVLQTRLAVRKVGVVLVVVVRWFQFVAEQEVGLLEVVKQVSRTARPWMTFQLSWCFRLPEFGCCYHLPWFLWLLGEIR